MTHQSQRTKPEKSKRAAREVDEVEEAAVAAAVVVGEEDADADEVVDEVSDHMVLGCNGVVRALEDHCRLDSGIHFIT